MRCSLVLKTMTFKKYVKCIVRVAYCISLRSQECMSSYFSNGFADASADWGLRKRNAVANGVFFLAVIGLCGGGISVWRAVLALSVTQVTTLYQQRLSASDHYGIVLTALLFVDPKVLLQTSGQLSLLMTFLIVMQRPIGLTWFWRSQFLTVLAAPVIVSLFMNFHYLGAF